MKPLALIESFILLFIVYFFWYPSSFPAENAATGIERSEWWWLLPICLLIGVLAYLLDGASWLPKNVRYGLAGVAGLLLVAAVLLPTRSTAIDRGDYVWMLFLLLAVMRLRFAVHGRLWTHTPLDDWMIALVVLCVLSVHYAPYPSRGYPMLARPVFGMALVVYFVELARTTRRLTLPVMIMVGLSLLVGMASITSTQWTEKSDAFSGILEMLPRVELFFATTGFNPNEIAGVLTWLIPLMVGVVLWFRRGSIGQIAAGGALVMLLAGLILGQSRSAIIATFIVLVMMGAIVVPLGRWRKVVSLVLFPGLAVALLAYLLLIVAPDTFHVFDDVLGVFSSRDTRSLDTRGQIWDSAFDIIGDQPLTGVGMDRFRYNPVRERYPVMGLYVHPPHAHNELLQVGSDLGIPGMIVFIGLNATMFAILWVSWQRSSPRDRYLVLGVFSALLAHIVYGFTDAIPLWDRFSFVYWAVLGLGAAQGMYTGTSLIRSRS